MADIAVVPEGEAYRVTVTESDGSTAHLVAATRADVVRLGGGGSAQSLIEASFRFLLDREPKESILPSFEITVIGRYFPEYEQQISDYLR